MPNSEYHVIALIPRGRPFDLNSVIETLKDDGLNPEVKNKPGSIGFRVTEDDGWGITAWLQDDDEAREMNQRLSEWDLPDGVTSEQIASCTAQLTIWSDNDSAKMNAHVFEYFYLYLKDNLGYFIFDNHLGEWR